MKDEIKEILDYLKKEVNKFEESKTYLMETYNYREQDIENIEQHKKYVYFKKLLDYITNLQETLKKKEQRIKELLEETYSANQVVNELLDIEEENKKLKELCDKYEEEHSTEFKIWKDERQQLRDYKSRNEKAIEFVKKESKICYTNQPSENPLKVIGNFMWHTDKLSNILQGEDKDE